ncbi:glutathione binding-like protein [Rhizobium oryzicola]|uniref:Glutathione binding-like protein n=1 Tax=Rhizobium oryzicola TaxID=1232668 RepID=A0ABT8T5D9_9HYPH|nr:glutathione binding-like protein [Rhizobium oryzicola]MDO1585438.1 glutathione binding-like protein [Rhizobium oryzicola]
MKLYYAPGVCSMAAHIVANEADILLELIKVDIRSEPHRVADGRNLKQLNEKCVVPVLELDDGRILTEGVAILHFLADQKPDAMLKPERDGFDHYRLHEWLTFISSELHKTFSPWLFHPEYGVDAANVAKERLLERFDFLDRHLASAKFLVGDRFSIADAYCFTIINWSEGRGIDLGRWPNLMHYMSIVMSRPAVRITMQAEGLSK